MHRLPGHRPRNPQHHRAWGEPLKLAVGLVLACLLGCGDYQTLLSLPDTTLDDTGYVAHVGETHRAEAYGFRSGGPMGSQSFDCDDGTIVSSDPSVITVGLAGYRDRETNTADDIAALEALYHAIAPGKATLTATCGDLTTSADVVVK